MGFADFSNAMGDFMRKTMHFHVMKYTIGWESNGKKPPILWGKCEYQFLRFSTYDGFCRILPGINFPGFPNSLGLAVFSHVMEN